LTINKARKGFLIQGIEMNKQNNLINIGIRQSDNIISEIKAMYATKKDDKDMRPIAAICNIFSITAQILYLDSGEERIKIHTLLDEILNPVDKKL